MRPKEHDERRQKKSYVKPEVRKHKAAAVVSGTSSGCSYYHARVSGYTYYY